MYKNKTATLDDVLHVGADKPVGYKLLIDLEKLSKLSPETVEFQLKAKGLSTLTLKDDECSMSGGAIYAWDEKALSAHLDNHTEELLSMDWPVTCEPFIRRLAIEWAEEKTKLFDIIADAFANTDHPARTDKRAADFKGRFRDEYLAHLESLEHGDPSNPDAPPPEQNYK